MNDTSILAARILALVYLSVAIGHFSRKDYFRSILSDFAENSGLVYLGGFMALVVGALLVHAHNLWVSDWRVLITIIGWLALAKGVILIAFPGLMKKVMLVCSLAAGQRAMTIACAILGLLFAWLGWMA